MFKEKILVIEDDVQIQNFMVYALENAGFTVESAFNGKDGINCMIRKNADLILLDLGLPDMDGMDVLHRIREWSEVPIIIVSARDQDREKAAALDDGADDYLTKPFSATELMARIRVALRHYYRMSRVKEAEKPDDTVYVNGELKLDNGAHMVYKNGQEIHMTPLEYQLLLLFMQNPGKVLTYHTILRRIWGEGYGEDTQVLRSVMASTRRKIEKNPAKPRYIETEIGIGYRMREHEAGEE
ncbi:MAG: response regulator [Lachnospiraceae bacterium]